MAPPPRMARPICLIEAYVDNMLRVNEDAQTILAKFSQPLVVVSILGPRRSGKSYLMSVLSGHWRGGFSVGHTRVNTRGIWMWCLPHPKKAGHTLVLLDTEGLGDAGNGDKSNDVLALAMLMSSAVIYNSTERVNQDTLEELNSKLQKHYKKIQEERAKSQNEMEVPSIMAPFLVWVIRDFTLNSDVGGPKVATDENLKKAEQGSATRFHVAQRQNEIRKMIKIYFPKQKCFFVGLPSSDKQLLNRLDEVPERELEAGFVSETQDLCKFILEQAPAKRWREDHLMTGSAFGQLLNSYVEVVTQDDIAPLESSMLNMSQEENRQALKRSTAIYENKMKTQQVSTEEEFQRMHEIALEEALREFEERYVIHDITSQAEYLHQIKEDLLRKSGELWKIQENLSRKTCEDLLERLMRDVDQAIRENKYHVPGGHGRFLQDRNNLIRRYNHEGNKGVKAQEVLKNFLDSLEEIENIILKTEQAISAKKLQQIKVVNPTDFTQLTQYIQSYQLPTGRFDRVLIQLFGFTGHGKSSFVNSCLYVLSKNGFQDKAGEGALHAGKSMERKAYKLTEAIDIVDNRGFVKLGTSEAWEIFAQLCHFSPLNETVEWEKSMKMRNDLLMTKSKRTKIPDLIVPVLVYSSECDLSEEDFTLLKHFLKQAQKMTGILPYVILTKCRAGSELENKFSRMGMERIYCVDNYVISNHLAQREKHLVLLNFLRDILLSVNFHLQESINLQTQQHEWTSFLRKMANEIL